MPPLIPVNEDFVRTEIAHQIHTARHRGDNYFCRSDEVLAQSVLSLLTAKEWAVGMVIQPKTKADA